MMTARRLQAIRNKLLLQTHASSNSVVFLGRGRMYVDPNEQRGRKVLRSNGVTRLRNSWLWRAASRAISPDLAIDVGANYGEIASAATYPTGCDVVLVEANQTLIPYLNRTKDSRKAREHWHIINAGASDFDGEMRFVEGDHSGESRLVTADPTGTIGNVRVIRLDGLAQCNAKRRILFKIDIEGEEVRALDGLSPVLAHADAYLGIIELSSENLARSGFLPTELWERVRTIGNVALFDKNDRLIDCSALDWQSICENSSHKHLKYDHGADLVMYKQVSHLQALAPPRWLSGLERAVKRLIAKN